MYPFTASTAITLGDDADPLDDVDFLTNVEIGRITASELFVGSDITKTSVTAGDISI